MDVREDLGTRRPGDELGSGLLEKVEQDRPCAQCVGVGPGDMRLGRVAPVAVRANDHVGDHGVAVLDDPPARDVDRATHVRGVRPRQQVAQELDRPARRELRGRLGRGEQLDLGGARDGAACDGLLAEPAELVRRVDLLELVPVLEQPDPIQRRVGRDGRAGHGSGEPIPGTGKLRREADPPCPGYGGYRGDGSDEIGDEVQVDPEAALA